MEFPTPQGLFSTTFEPPPLDGSLLLPEIFDRHAERSPNHPLFRYLDSYGGLNTIPWSRAVQAFHKVAHITRQRVDAETCGIRPVIGIVAAMGQYICPEIPFDTYFFFSRPNYLFLTHCWNFARWVSSIPYISSKFGYRHRTSPTIH